MTIVIKLIIFYTVIYSVTCTLSKSNKKTKSGSIKATFDEYDNLELNVKSIISNGLFFNKSMDSKFFSGPSLAYVTPWNGYGYEMAKIHSKKFSIISPVWFQFQYDGSNFFIKGEQDIDKQWIAKIRNKNSEIKIIPRLIFENWNPTNYHYVMGNEYILNQCINVIHRLIESHKFDGIMLEMWLQIAVYSVSDTVHFLEHLHKKFKSDNLIIVLAAPPPVYQRNQPGYFTNEYYKSVMPYIDYLSLMTYDYSSSGEGPNSPIKWVEQCFQLLSDGMKMSDKSRILLGLNFYGYFYSYSEVKPIVRHEFIDLLKNSKDVQMEWDKEYKEHKFLIWDSSGKQSIIWYPTQESVSLRLKLATKLGAGISIWEIGQGLDYFYDVL